MKKRFHLPMLCISALLFTSYAEKTTAGSIHESGQSSGQIAFPFCSGDYLVMDLTDDYEVHGSVNNNRAMLNVKHHLTGKGTSILTGENFTMDTEIDTHENVPVTKGAMVLRFSVSDDIRGDQGGLQAVNIKSHETRNANGRQTSSRFSVDPTCR